MCRTLFPFFHRDGKCFFKRTPRIMNVIPIFMIFMFWIPYWVLQLNSFNNFNNTKPCTVHGPQSKIPCTTTVYQVPKFYPHSRRSSRPVQTTYDEPRATTNCICCMVRGLRFVEPSLPNHRPCKYAFTVHTSIFHLIIHVFAVLNVNIIINKTEEQYKC